MKTNRFILTVFLLLLLAGQELFGQPGGSVSVTAQRTRVNPPEQDLLLIGAVQCKQERPFDVPGVWAENGFNTEQLLHLFDSGGCHGFFVPEKHREELLRYIQSSGKSGIDIILYLNVHTMIEEQYREHPEFAQRDKAGGLPKSYATQYYVCVNSPFLDYTLHSVSEAAKTRIKGIFLDGPLFTPKTCWCSHCRDKFSEQYGHPMEEATSREYMTFKTGCITEYVCKVSAALHAVNPEAVLYCNSQALSTNRTGMSMDDIFPCVDYLGAEGGFIFYGNPSGISVHKGSATAKYLECKSHGKPCVVFSAANHQPYARYMHEASESTLQLACTVAGGANVWYGVHGPVEALDSEGPQTGMAFSRYLSDNRQFYSQTCNAAKIGLFWSDRTVNTFMEDVDMSDFTAESRADRSNRFGSHQDEFRGVYDMLVRSHLPFAIIDEATVTAGPSGYDLIILPNVLCMTQPVVAALEKYVQNGGNLLATGATSYYSEDGTLQKLPALANLFGVASVEGFTVYAPGCGYMDIHDSTLVAQARGNFTAGMGACVRNSYAVGIQVLASHREPLPGRYDLLPAENFPVFVSRQTGAGRVLFMAGNIGETYQNFGLLDFRRMVEYLASTLASPPFTVNGLYETVEVTERKKRDGSMTMFHFVNYTGTMQRPIEKVIPCRGAVMEYKTQQTVKRVYSPYAGTDIPFERKAGSIRFTVPDMEEYQLVVIE
jgi:hypothetical protein